MTAIINMKLAIENRFENWNFKDATTGDITT